MAVEKRYDKWYIRFQYKKKDISMATEASGKREAEDIERSVKKALRTGCYDYLEPLAREVCIRFFGNQRVEAPDSLRTSPNSTHYEAEAKSEMTLKEAAKLCWTDPETRGKSDEYRGRFKICLTHLLAHLGPDTLIKDIRVVHIKRYALEREQEGAAFATIKRERGALSKIYRILLENDLIDKNPVSLVRLRDDRLGRRRVYISAQDFQRILYALPEWCKPVALTAYYTGMRQGEVRQLTRSQLLLDRRMIRLDPRDTKEQNWKLVPIHKDLALILRDLLKSQVVGLDKVFLRNGYPVTYDEIAYAWPNAVNSVGLPDLHFHDLRHTWKTNARRSGVDGEIRAMIMGHADRIGSIHEGYGVISEKELLDSVDKMTFDHGETDIWIAKKAVSRTPQTKTPRTKTGSKPGLQKIG